MDTTEFKERAKSLHGGKYDYSKVKYINYKTPNELFNEYLLDCCTWRILADAKWALIWGRL